MTGTSNGFISLLGIFSPYIFNVHCINHRLALAASDVNIDLPYLVEYIELFSDISSFLRKSTKRTHLLKQYQLTLEEPEVKILKMCPTR